MVFSEDSRVKIPCILHLMRLGYRYLSLKNAVWDEETNIFPALFREAKIEYSDLTPEQFAEKLQGFTDRLDGLFKESAGLEQEIKKQLAGLRYE